MSVSDFPLLISAIHTFFQQTRFPASALYFSVPHTFFQRQFLWKYYNRYFMTLQTKKWGSEKIFWKSWAVIHSVVQLGVEAALLKNFITVEKTIYLALKKSVDSVLAGAEKMCGSRPLPGAYNTGSIILPWKVNI